MANLNKLEQLDRLRERGVLSEEEFGIQKERILKADQGISRSVLIGLGVLLIVIALAALFAPRVDYQPEAKKPVKAAVIAAPQTEPAEELPPPPARLPLSSVSAATERLGIALKASDVGYFDDAYSAVMSGYAELPSPLRKVVANYAGANELCRGSSDTVVVDKWCPVRDALGDKLGRLGMCYGRPSDTSGADSDWHLCDERDLAQ